MNASAPEPVPTEAVDEPAAAPVTAEADAGPIAVEAAPEGEVANEGALEPAIKPIVIGSGAEPAEKKRGWWRR